MSNHPLSTVNIPFLLKEMKLSPKKSLGQNFLRDDLILDQIVSCANIKPTDTVLEIGPGLGSLTRYLANSARSVVTVEIDRNLFPALQAVLEPFKNVKLVHGDILDINPSWLMDVPDYLVVANIPYYITSAVIRHLLEAENRPSQIVLTVQKEVAQRICEKAGKLSLLALGVQVYGSPELVMEIPASAFYPPPNVDSAVIKITIYKEPLIPEEHLDTFFKLAKAGFSQKRKTLKNSLSGGLHLDPSIVNHILNEAGIDPQRRAETLSLEEWGKLCKSKSQIEHTNLQSNREISGLISGRDKPI